MPASAGQLFQQHADQAVDEQAEQQVEPDQHRRLLENHRLLSLEADQLLVLEQDESQGLFLLRSGLVKVRGFDLDGQETVLALLGDPAALAHRAVAVVGARNASAAGRRLAEQLAEALAAAGIVVVSGLARGIDAAAHLGALRSGATIACVAGGIDEPYWTRHRHR